MKAGDIITLPGGITVTYVKPLTNSRHLVERKWKGGTERYVIGRDEDGTLDILGKV